MVKSLGAIVNTVLEMTKKTRTEPNSDHSLASVDKVTGNEDLIREILFRSPVRSLFNFTLVSKQWLSLIKNPQFSLHHTLQANPSFNIPSGLYFYNSLTSSNHIETVSFQNVPIQLPRIRVPSISFLNSVGSLDGMEIIQSCNGLLLCRLTYQSSKVDYCVCNPTTKKFTVITQPSIVPPEEVFGFNLAFDPSISLYYKIVCIGS